MDAVYKVFPDSRAPECDTAYDLNAWLTVSGDADDFIFYNEPEKFHSER